ncbi:MAG: YvcK family protein [Chloroflexi bacterium]|nr:MAG: YvcK family protein [Chloroflexota bacterium]
MMKSTKTLLQNLAQGTRWFIPGLGIKRWVLLISLGSTLIGLGGVYLILWLYRLNWLPERLYNLVTLQFLPIQWRIILPLGIGVIAIFWGMTQIGISLTAPFRQKNETVLDALYNHYQHSRGPHIVVIGGGTGLPTLLRGLREYTRNITAIVTVADDGGSSGRLRRELGVLPPGDFRNNIAALSRDEALMTQLLQYRFGSSTLKNGQRELQGHAFGNLLLAALAGITGSFDEALLAAERVLAMRGRVLPATLEQVTLVADVLVTDETGTAVSHHVIGESTIPKFGGKIQKVGLTPPNVRAYPPALQAIFQADLIVMGPGSLYTSILPNLLVPDLAEALRHARAPKVYVCNIATQPGETDNYTVADHVAALLRHLPPGCLDIVLANDNLALPTQTGGGQTVYVQPTPPEGVKFITADLVDEARPWRHDSQKLARAIITLLSS